MDPEQRTRERLIALVIVAALVLNYPLLSLFGSEGLWLGIPVLYLYLFATWLLFIVLTAALMRTTAASNRDTTRRLADDSKRRNA
jgi:hypothetical protein